MTPDETLLMLQLQASVCRQDIQIAQLRTELAARELQIIEPKITELTKAKEGGENA